MMNLFGAMWIPDSVIWVIAIIIILYIYGTWPFSTLSSYGYKGPRPWPLVGNLFMIFPDKKTQYFGSCDGWLKKKYGNMVATYFGRQPDLIVYDPEILKHILVKDFSNFADHREMALRSIFSKSLTDLKGQEWRRVRGLLSPFFTTNKLKHHLQVLNVSIGNMLQTLDQHLASGDASGQPVDAKKVFGDFTMQSICLTAFGVDIKSDDDKEHPIVTAAKKLMNPTGFNLHIFLSFMFPFINPLLERMGASMFDAHAVKVLSRFVDAAIEERKQSNEVYPDFIQALLKAHDVELDQEARETMGEVLDHTNRGKGLTNEEITSHSVLFLLGGYDTTSSALSFLMLNLASHPQWQERVAMEINGVIGDQDITYDNLKQLETLDMCLDESLRLYPPAFRADRHVNDDITINGHFIPKGIAITIPIYVLHHDPDMWTDPEVFDPERFSPDKKKDVLNSYTYFPFGAGPRSCVAMRLALMEVKIAAVRMIQKYRWTVSRKTKLPIELGPTFFATVKGGLWLDMEKR